jgi:hypothetical protein
MTRITRKMLESRIEYINTVLGTPLTPYTKTDSGFSANIGNLHLSQAYGGYCVHEMHNDAGGVSTPIWAGHIPARDAYGRMCAFVNGLRYKE